MYTLDFWKDAGQRAVRTFGQVLIGFLGVGAGFGSVDWANALSVAGVSAIASVINSILAPATPPTPSVPDGDGAHRG